MLEHRLTTRTPSLQQLLTGNNLVTIYLTFPNYLSVHNIKPVFSRIQFTKEFQPARDPEGTGES